MSQRPKSFQLYYRCSKTDCVGCDVKADLDKKHAEYFEEYSREVFAEYSGKVYMVVNKLNEIFVLKKLPGRSSYQINVTMTKPERCVLNIKVDFDSFTSRRLNVEYIKSVGEKVLALDFGTFEKS